MSLNKSEKSYFSSVWVVEGHFDYEGFEIIAICETEAIARMFEEKIERRYDSVEVNQYPYFTGVGPLTGMQEVSI